MGASPPAGQTVRYRVRVESWAAPKVGSQLWWRKSYSEESPEPRARLGPEGRGSDSNAVWDWGPVSFLMKLICMDKVLYKWKQERKQGEEEGRKKWLEQLRFLHPGPCDQDTNMNPSTPSQPWTCNNCSYTAANRNVLSSLLFLERS